MLRNGFSTLNIRKSSVRTFSAGIHKGAAFFMLLGLSVLTIACGQQEKQVSDTPPVLQFSAIPDQNSTDLQRKLEPFAQYLSKELGLTVTYVPARDYQASVEMFKNGDVLLAWFGGLTGVQARAAVEGARAIAQGEADPEYFSYFIAHESTGLEPSETFPESLGQFTFTFGSQGSTSGRLMPEFFIRQATDLVPEAFFEQPLGFSGSHDLTVQWVSSGRFQAGAVNYKVYDQWVASGKIDPEVCQVIWKTPPYADYNWTAHPDLEKLYGPGFIDRLQQVLISIEDPELLAALPRNRLIVAQNEDYAQIQDVALQLGMLR